MQLTDIPITDILAMKITDSDTDIFQFINSLLGTFSQYKSYTDNFILYT